MALHFVLDGYNIIKQTGFLDELAFASGREKLIKLIESFQPQGSTRNQVTVVFDGRPGMSSPQSAAVKLVFTYDETADEWIKRFVDNSPGPKNIVVVTNDREIQRHVRNVGAAVWPVKDFVWKLKPGPEPAGSKSAVPGRRESKVISKSLEYRINAELEALWLKKSKSG